MIFTLILITAILSLVHYLGLESFLVYGIGLPLPVYLGILSFLMTWRLVLAVYKFSPVVRKVYRHLMRWADLPDQPEGNKSQVVSAPKKSNGVNLTQKKGFHTSCVRPFTSSVPMLRSRVTPQLREKVLVKNRVSSGVSITKTKVNATFGLKSKGLLLGVFLRLLLPIGLNKTANRAKTILSFLYYCQRLHNTQGMKGLVNYLKASQVLFQQCLGGFRLADATELKCRPSRNGQGMPRIINSQDRALIRAGDWKLAKFYMTLFAIYRILEFPGLLKLKTITDGFKGNMEPGGLYHQIVLWAPTFARMLLDKAKENAVKPLDKRGVEPRPIVKSAPGTVGDYISTTPFVLVSQASNLKRLGLGDCVEYFIKYFEKGTKIPFPGLLRIFQGAASIPLFLIPSLQHSVGKLGFKEEPAGKVRVFAMADAWTQWILEPFHQYLFDILRTIPMDGTFDQLKPVIAKAATAKAAYSLDLSAATDRLPMSIQQTLFSHLVSQEFSVQWTRLLVGRGYMAFSNKYNISELLHYAVGQPMGALSSWASLATTHHFIVQCAAWDAGVVPVGTWFMDYAVLGDDLVIFNYKVKKSYLLIVDALGVECGIAKSLLSPKGLAIEFAKRTFWKGQDISPVPLLEFISANLTLSDAISFARKYSLTFPMLLRTLGYGYRVVGGLNKHIGKLNSRVRALLFAYHLPQTEAEVSSMLTQGNPLLSAANLDLVLQEFKKYLTEDYSKTMSARLKALPSPAELIKEQSDIAMNTLMNRLRFGGFLNVFLDKIAVPPASTAVGTEVLPDVFYPFVGWRRPGFEVSNEMPEGTSYVPDALFNRLENTIRGWRLAYERLVKLIVTEPMSTFRADASKLIRFEIYGIKWNRTMQTTYLHLLQVQRLMSRAGTGKVPLFREMERLQWGSDPVQMRF